MKKYDFNDAIARAEAILAEKGFLKPTRDVADFHEFETYHPVTVRPGFIFKKVDLVAPTGERVVFSIFVVKIGGQVFTEIYQRITTNLVK